MNNSYRENKIVKKSCKKRKQVLISPGEKLLKKIRPYSASILSFHHGSLPRTKEMEEIISSIQSLIEEIQKNKIYSKLQNDILNRSLVLEIFYIIGFAKTYNEPPFLKEFTDDVYIFLKISEKHPQLISKTAEVLNYKYSDLWNVSEDFYSWNCWLLSYLRPKRVLNSLWGDFESDQNFTQLEAIDFANAVLDAIPSDPGLRYGRPKNFGLRKIIEQVDLHWLGAGIKPMENRTIFYSYLEQLNAALYANFYSKIDETQPLMLKPSLESERKIIREIIEKKVPVKKWEGGAKTTIYCIGNARFGSLEWFKRKIMITLTQARRLPNSRERKNRMYQFYKKQFLSNIFDIKWLLKFMYLFFSAK
ncbi:hypothetical protein WH96_11245 [Kiloniella spongiae]|uniref:Uncharacterized protein n=1 Tax=Kiloniella spongiae TaxID=1489064 RepID=A0A0H2MJS7_9PROT|nr:hypothetical protein [Kiloniella spongiae]KLN60992.1 hypothetical protein WH96_11245 [Kiloniella spongiae]